MRMSHITTETKLNLYFFFLLFLNSMHFEAIVYFFNKFSWWYFAYLSGNFRFLNLNVCLCPLLFQEAPVASWTKPCDYIRPKGMHAPESTHSNVSQTEQMLLCHKECLYPCIFSPVTSRCTTLHSSVSLVCTEPKTMKATC